MHRYSLEIPEPAPSFTWHGAPTGGIQVFPVINSGVATGGQGGPECPLDNKKIIKNQEKRGKEGKNQEKREKIRKKSQKSLRFFHFAPPDR